MASSEQQRGSFDMPRAAGGTGLAVGGHATAEQATKVAEGQRQDNSDNSSDTMRAAGGTGSVVGGQDTESQEIKVAEGQRQERNRSI